MQAPRPLSRPVPLGRRCAHPRAVGLGVRPFDVAMHVLAVPGGQRHALRSARMGYPVAEGADMYVNAREGEPFEELYRRFKRGMEASGILREYRSKQRFRPAHEEQRDKIRAAARKRRRAREKRPRVRSSRVRTGVSSGLGRTCGYLDGIRRQRPGPVVGCDHVRWQQERPAEAGLVGSRLRLLPRAARCLDRRRVARRWGTGCGRPEPSEDGWVTDRPGTVRRGS